MKKLLLLFLIVIVYGLFNACTQKAPSENSSSEKEKVEAPKKETKKNSVSQDKLIYLKELQSQKDELNEKSKYWTARTIITDSEEKILDLDSSLDGKWILYVTKGKENSYIYALDTQMGTMPRMVYKDTRSIFWARFNETSDKILFSTNDSSGKFYLSIIDINKPIFQIPERSETALDGSIDTCAISPQKVIAITHGGQINSDENGFSIIKGEPSIELKKDDVIFRTFKKARTPSWSKNGKSLLFISEMFGQPEIVKWDIEERGIQRITTSKGGNNNPRFSPDNDWIIYNSNESGKNNIYIINLNDQIKKRVTYMKDMEFFKPVWGHDNIIYAIGLKNKTSYLFQFKMEAKMFQVQINGEPGPGLTKVLSPIDNAENDLEKE